MTATKKIIIKRWDNKMFVLTYIDKFKHVYFTLKNPEIMEKASKNCYRRKEYISPLGKVYQCQGYEPFALKKLIEETISNEVRNKISNPISLNLFSGNFDDVFDLIDSDLEIANLNEVFQRILQGKSQIRNLGVDLPLSFGDITSTTNRTMVVAMDPKRNNKIENFKVYIYCDGNLKDESPIAIPNPNFKDIQAGNGAGSPPDINGFFNDPKNNLFGFVCSIFI